GTGSPRVLGVFREDPEGGRIIQADRKSVLEWRVSNRAADGVKDGELVEAEQSGAGSRMGPPMARILCRLGDPTAPGTASRIAIRQYEIPDVFPEAAIAEAGRAEPAGLEGREDLRDLPFVTIDPADARDHDDAVWAHADDDPNNEGGHVVWIAVADVAHYVISGSALDREARKRGNSTYFPDRVVPMLPDRLSEVLCSLHENASRACIALRVRLDADGRKIGHRFVRGLMRSKARLNYEEVQAARNGCPNDRCAPLMADVIAPLYAAYHALARARAERQPLDLELPERRIVLSKEGRVSSVAFKDRLDAHRLVEEFMILANVTVAEALRKDRQPLLYRVHEEPGPEKFRDLREVAAASGFGLAWGQSPKTRHLNRLLREVSGTEFDALINMTTLRSMTRAYYSAENFGHFGLALETYAHFTSPIRRYSDLVTHRALISNQDWDQGGSHAEETDQLDATARHISGTERRSMLAERDASDRCLAAYLSRRVGDEFEGRISSVARFGIFVRLAETGAEALIPVQALGREFFHYDRRGQNLRGADTGLTIGLGQAVTVRLVEALPATGQLVLDLLALGDRPAAKALGRRHGLSKRRKKTGARVKFGGARRKKILPQR
ncbi:MAG: VacB/RNase II family 3'-5' exoribonuclease, partial [Pseudomonadota bacterium]